MHGTAYSNVAHPISPWWVSAPASSKLEHPDTTGGRDVLSSCRCGQHTMSHTVQHPCRVHDKCKCFPATWAMTNQQADVRTLHDKTHTQYMHRCYTWGPCAALHTVCCSTATWHSPILPWWAGPPAADWWTRPPQQTVPCMPKQPH